MEHEHFSYPEALRYLAKKYNIKIEEKEQTPEEIMQQSLREKMFNINEFAENAPKGAVGIISKSYAHRLTIWLAVLHLYASETFHNCKINKNPTQDIPILCIFTPQNLTYGETREKTLPVGCLCLDI